MNHSLLHIFDNSACLTKRQLKDYVSGAMMVEECHAAEVHLNSCLFCSEAVDGMLANKENDSVAALATVDSDFLKEHFSLSHPEVHLNSIAPAQAAPLPVTPARRRGRQKTQPFRHSTGIAAMLLMAFGVLWYIKYGKTSVTQNAALQEAIAESRASARAAKQDVKLIPQQSQPSNANTSGVLALASTVPIEAGKVTEAGSSTLAPQKEPEQLRPQSLVTTSAKEPVTAQKEAVKVENEEDEIAVPDEANTSKNNIATAIVNAPIAANSFNAAANSDLPESSPAKAKIAAPEKKTTVAASALEQANAGFKKGSYKTALSAYKKEMSSADKATRQYATVMAARCYSSLGDKDKAAQLLESLVSEGGPQKRTAKRMLRELKK